MADIGEKLKSAREAKGLSIGDIEKATKIQSRYLTAIENNEFDKLPGDFYVRAFIRQYAQVVGLDGKELLSDYHEDVPEADPDQYVENSIDNKSEEVRQTTDNKKNLWKNYLPRIAIALGVIVVILVVYFLYAHISSGGQSNQADNNSVTVSSQKSSSSSKKPKKKVVATPVKVKKINDNEYRVLGLKKNRKLVVRAGSTQNISAGVTIDNNSASAWNSTLLAKQKHTVKLPANAERVVITLGNDNGTSITIGGKKIPYAPNNAYRTITLLIGKAKKTTSNNSNSQSNTTNNDNNSNDSSTTQSSQTQSSTTHNREHSQSSQTQSSTTQSSQTQQSSSTQSSSATQSNNGGGNNDGGNGNNDNNGN